VAVTRGLPGCPGTPGGWLVGGWLVGGGPVGPPPPPQGAPLSVQFAGLPEPLPMKPKLTDAPTGTVPL
jgi:hypothetical protein